MIQWNNKQTRINMVQAADIKQHIRGQNTALKRGVRSYR